MYVYELSSFVLKFVIVIVLFYGVHNKDDGRSRLLMRLITYKRGALILLSLLRLKVLSWWDYTHVMGSN